MLKALFVCVLAAVFLRFATGFAGAATFVVTSPADSGAGTLRAAIVSANGNQTDDIIYFDLPGAGPHTIDLVSSLPTITQNLEILNDRAGDESITVQRSFAAGTPQFRLFFLGRAVVTMAGLTLANGDARGMNSVTGLGGAISGGGGVTLNLRGCTVRDNLAVKGGGIGFDNFSSQAPADVTVTLTNCVFTGNSTIVPGQGSGPGGGLYTTCSQGNCNLTVVRCGFSGNSAATGGAIEVFVGSGASGVAVSSITRSTFTGNTAVSGGAISHHRSSLLIRQSTFNSNSTTGQSGFTTGLGGAVYQVGGAGAIENCTFSGNSAQGGGALEVTESSSMSLNSVTMSGNHAASPASFYGGGGGIRVAQGSTGRLSNSIVAGNTTVVGGADVNGAFVSQGHNFVGTGSGATGFTNGANGDQVGGNGNPVLDPRLDVLRDNGGATLTRALLPESGAINAGNDSSAAQVDQRGFARSGVSDIGAFEFGAAAPEVPVVSIGSSKPHGVGGASHQVSMLGSNLAVEPRTRGAAGDYSIVFRCAHPLVSVGSVAVTGAATVVSSAIAADPREYVVNLTSVGNAQTLAITLTNVLDSQGNQSAAIGASLGILIGDSNGDGAVNSGDALQTRGRAGQAADAANFRSDINADGTVNSGDTISIRARSGTALPTANDSASKD